MMLSVHGSFFDLGEYNRLYQLLVEDVNDEPFGTCEEIDVSDSSLTCHLPYNDPLPDQLFLQVQ